MNRTSRVNGTDAGTVDERPEFDQLNLSARQKAVAVLVADGLCDCEIAAKLGLSEQTVGSYLKTIFRRYGVHTRTALAIRVMKEKS